MRNVLPITLLVFSSVFGCAALKSEPLAESPVALHKARVIAMTFNTIDDEDNPYGAASFDARQTGDWITTQFESAGAKPIVVQQRVLSRVGAESVVEVAIMEGPRMQTFRLRMQTTRAGEEVLDVTRVENGVEHASSPASYDAAMAKTVPNVERNDGFVDSEPVTVEVAGKKLEAVRTTYNVVVRGKPATMTVVHSDAFAWGDLGGEIISKDGKVLYSTRVTERGSGPSSVAERY